MSKKPLFSNPSIYQEPSDYVIGGFRTLKEELSFSSIKEQIYMRVNMLLQRYIERQDETYLALLADGEKVDENHGTNIAKQQIQDNLDTIIMDDDLDSLTDAIMRSEEMITFLNKLRCRFDKNTTESTTTIGERKIKTNIKAGEEFDLDQCELNMAETTFESFIEHLAGIYN